MKTMKKVGFAAGAVLAVLLIAAFVVFGQLGRLIKRGVEAAGPPITGTSVTLGSARVSIFDGDGSLHHLRIANPAGFSDADAFNLGEVALSVDPKSVTGGVVHVRSIVIDGPELLAEFNAAGRSNLDAILEHVRGAGSSGGGSAKSGGKEVRLIVDEFRFSNAKLHALAPAYKLDKTLTLPTIELKDIGARQGGVIPSQLAAEIMRPVIGAAAQAAASEYLKAQGGSFLDRLLKK